MISWQARGRHGPSGASQIGVAVLIVTTLGGLILFWGAKAGWLPLEGAMGYAPLVLLAPTVVVVGFFILRRTLAWLAG